MTIQEGINFNRRRHLLRRRQELVTAFNRAADGHRSVAGVYITGSHRGADYLLGEIAKVDAKLSTNTTP